MKTLITFKTILSLVAVFPSFAVALTIKSVQTQISVQAAGSPLANPTLISMPANSVKIVSSFSCQNPVGENDYSCTYVHDFSGMAYDPQQFKFFLFGGGHATTFTDALYEFNPSTLTWRQLYAPSPVSSWVPSNFDKTRAAWLAGPSGPYPRPISRHTYDELAVVNGEFIILAMANGGNTYTTAQFASSGGDPMFSSARVAHYSFQNSSWTFSPTAMGDALPESNFEVYPASEVDPISKKILTLSPTGLFVYDPSTKVKTRVIRGDFDEFKNSSGQVMSYSTLSAQMAYDRNFVYSSHNDKFYYLNPPYVLELNFNRQNPSGSTLTLVASSGISTIGGTGRGFDYDSKNKVIVGGLNNNEVKIFNPSTHVWSTSTVSGGTPGDAGFHVWRYDPINNVFFFQGFHTTQFWAYRYK